VFRPIVRFSVGKMSRGGGCNLQRRPAAVTMQLLSPQNNPLSVSYNECALYSFNIGLPLFSRSISNELSPNRIGCNMGRVVTPVRDTI